MSTHVVILAGGAGTRFWPAGRRDRPKQLLTIASENTMLRETLLRCAPLAPPERTWIVTNERQAADTRKEAPEIPDAQILAEPEMRNTAAAIALAAACIARHDGDAVMVVLPADHVIGPQDLFTRTFEAAVARAREASTLLTVGIRPTGPATGYGYIESGEKVAEVDGFEVLRVQSFVEKPDARTAAGFFAAGGYFWNAGTFVWSVAAFLAALDLHLPAHRAVLDAMAPELDAGRAPSADAYARFENVPVDIGIMERADNVEVIPASFDWDDVGSWLALDRLRTRDEKGNVVIGEQIGIDTRNCIVVARPDHVVATLDISDLIVVCTPDATLVCRKDRAEDVKKIVEQLKKRGLEERT
ncbi:MAG: mannose-1-phosphate guanylyltransferase [Planctomycetota bacterium]